MKAIILTTLLVALQSAAMASTIELSGEAGKSVCELVRSTRYVQITNNSRDMDRGPVFEAPGNKFLVYGEKGQTIECQNGIAKINGSRSDVR